MSLAQIIHFSRLAKRLSRVPHRDSEYVARLRGQRLQNLLRHARTAPFFQEKYRGLDLERIELSQLPPTTKQELMSRFDDVVTDRAVRRNDVEQFILDPANLGRYFRGRYAVSHTSGSEGQPLIVIQDRHCLDILFGTSATRGVIRKKLDVLEGVHRLFRPTRLAVITMHRGFYPSGAAFEFLPSIAGPFVRMTRLSAMQPDLFEKLNKLRPNSIVAYPSVLEWLAVRSDQLRLAPHLRQVGCTSENLTDRARQRIVQAFGVPIFDHYGIGECLFLADGCPTDGGAHVNADWAILEVVDRDNRAVLPGQPGAKILVTNLANTVQPIIRYEVCDVVTMANHACGCGSRLPWIARIDGRAADVFWIGQGQELMVGGLVFQNGVENLHQIREWQAVQLDAYRVEIRLEPLPGVVLDQEAAERFVIRKLEELGLPAQVKVSVRVVSQLAPDPATGKFRRMVSHIEPPAEFAPTSQTSVTVR